MMRLSAPDHQRLTQAETLEVTFGGSEANVAASLIRLGASCDLVTCLPCNAIGDAALSHLQRYGVSSRWVQRGGRRMGLYFLEHGVSQRPSKVVYDREDSSFSTMQLSVSDWNNILEAVDWFHFSGITPALSGRAHAMVARALEVAQVKEDLRVSCDLNYRSKLWSVAEARRCMRPLMSQVDVLIANEEDLWHCLGLRADRSDVEAGHLDKDAYAHLARTAAKRYKFQAVAITMRESVSASFNRWSAVLAHEQEGETVLHSTKYDIQVLDRVGAGDAFAAGLIYGLLALDSDSQKALEFAVAASCLAHTTRGDFNLATRLEVEALMQGTGSGRVVR